MLFPSVNRGFPVFRVNKLSSVPLLFFTLIMVLIINVFSTIKYDLLSINIFDTIFILNIPEINPVKFK